ncbi:hypothetical protein QOZ80_4AG0321560 [Eleusine coracana subsp. coracana]|nr:hypothetical protein QOZ80_4AG0321560 [Eleusine coracana subsp. coracana]
MENEGAQNNKSNHDSSLNIGTDDDTAELTWSLYDLDDLLGDDVNASTDDSDTQISKDNHPGNAASSRYKRHNIQQIQALEALFQSCTHPDEGTRKALGAKIGMESQQIKNWFQNRRSQNKMRSCSEQNDQIRAQNDALKAENVMLRKRILDRTCSPCLCLTGPPELLTEKQRLIVENARLKEEFQRAEANLKELSRGAPLPLAVPSIAQDRVTLLLQRGERAMKELRALADAGEPMWQPSSAGGYEVLNEQEYTPAVFPRLVGQCPEGFVSEGTRETAIVWARAADVVEILTDVGRWSDMFPGIVAAVTARDVGSSTMPGSRNGMIQLMNAELWVQSPRMPNRSVKFLRFTKMRANGRQWAVVDVSIDTILADGQEGGVEPPERTRCLLLPSGCLLEDIDNGCCKITWIVHAEYDETAVPELLRPLLRSGQALGASRWLSTLIRKCELMGVQKNFRQDDRRKGVMEVAQRMTASFYAAISGPITLPGSNISEWRGSVGSGNEMFEAALRMVLWNCPSTVPGQPASYMQVLSATTTLWLPNTEPQALLDYLCDERRRSEWDILANGSVVKEIGSIMTGNHHRNVISIADTFDAPLYVYILVLLCTLGFYMFMVTDGTDNKTVMLQEVCSDKSFSMVVYSLMEEKAMIAVTNGTDPSSGFLLPSGFAILPDGHRKTCPVPSVAQSSSNAPAGHDSALGCFLTAAYQTVWPNPPTENLAADTFDAIGKQLCGAIDKIKTAVKAQVVIPA